MKKVGRFFVIILLFVVIIMIIEWHPLKQNLTENNEETLVAFEEFKKDTLDHTLHFRIWESQNNLLNLMYRTFAEISENAGINRSLISTAEDSESYAAYWGHIYKQLADIEVASLRFIIDSISLSSKRISQDPIFLANTIVSFVQDIPYTLILSSACDGTYEPCQGDVDFGLLSPYEFLHTEIGDCDTRSVLLYKLLLDAGLNPLILVSKEYRHAMIAVDLPASGDFILYGGRKHYVWETTSTGWPLGMLPPENNNIKYWNIALAYE